MVEVPSLTPPTSPSELEQTLPVKPSSVNTPSCRKIPPTTSPVSSTVEDNVVE